MTELLIFILFILLTFSSVAQEQLPRVAGGELAKLEDFPFIVFIEIYKKNLDGHCTGSIIHPKWILTAAHCTLNADKLKIYAALADIKKKDPKTQVRDADFYRIYPCYEHWTMTGYKPIPTCDYSVIKLVEGLDIDNTTVGLLELTDKPWKDGTKKHCTAVGYGVTPGEEMGGKLYFTDVEASFGTGACPCHFKSYQLASFICLSMKEEKTACPGDSGGPLVCEGVQVGIASHIYASQHCNLFWMQPLKVGCGVQGTVSAYVYLYRVLPWIREQIHY